MGLSVEEVASIYRRHADVVYRRCLAMLGSREEALDAVQEIFIKVLTHGLTFRGDSDPTTWIYRITTNHALNRLRCLRRFTDIEEVPVSLRLCAPGPEGQVISRQLLARLIEKMDDRSRAILFLHFSEGLDQSEVASVLGISRRAVVKRLTRIRAELEALMAGVIRPGEET